MQKLYSLFITLAFVALSMGAQAQTWNIGSPNAADVTATLSDGTLTISGTGTMQNVQSIPGNAFAYCKNITSITIPESVTSIGLSAFSFCTGLTIVNYNATNCITSGSLFRGTSVTTIHIGENVQSISGYAFGECSKLTSITIPASVTSIGVDAFAYCPGLTAIHVEAGNPNYRSVDGVLYNGDATTLIACPEGKTGTYIIPGSVLSIEKNAFLNCTGLTEITIPNSVGSIGDGAFSTIFSTSSLTDLYVSWTTPPSIHPDVFDGVTISDVNLHIPAGTQAAYQAAAVWQDFNLQAIENINSIHINSTLYAVRMQASTGEWIEYLYSPEIIPSNGLLAALDTILPAPYNALLPSDANEDAAPLFTYTSNGVPVTENQEASLDWSNFLDIITNVVPGETNTISALNQPTGDFVEIPQTMSAINAYADAVSYSFLTDIYSQATPTYINGILTPIIQSVFYYYDVDIISITLSKEVSETTSPTSYGVSTGTFSNGTVETADGKAEYEEGETVTLTILPDAGYELDVITVAYNFGNVHGAR